MYAARVLLYPPGFDPGAAASAACAGASASANASAYVSPARGADGTHVHVISCTLDASAGADSIERAASVLADAVHMPERVSRAWLLPVAYAGGAAAGASVRLSVVRVLRELSAQDIDRLACSAHTHAHAQGQ